MEDGDVSTFSCCPDSNDQVAWTASKCNRLLRPLTSKLARIERLRRQSHLKDQPVVRSCDDPHASQNGACADSSLPIFTPKARVRKTYKRCALGDKQSKQSSSHDGPTTPAAGAFTPYLRKTLLDARDRDSRGEGTVHTEVLATSEKLDAPRTDFGAIIEDFRRLLRATEAQSGRPPEESRSMFAICLRKVPQCMANEEVWRQSENPDDKSDVYGETYSLLEGLGHSNNGGWGPLRQVVRAHGIELMEDALKQRFFNANETRKLLAMLCAGNYQIIASRMGLAWLHSYELLTPRMLRSGRSSDTQLAYETSATEQRQRLLLRSFNGPLRGENYNTIKENRLHNLIVEGAIPLASLDCHEIQSVLLVAIERLSCQSHQTSADCLFENMLLCLCGIDPHMEDRLLKLRKTNGKEILRFVAPDNIVALPMARRPSSRRSAPLYSIAARSCTLLLAVAMLVHHLKDQIGGESNTRAAATMKRVTLVIRRVSLSILRAYTYSRLLDACRASGQTDVATQVLLADVVLRLHTQSSGDPRADTHIAEELKAIELLLSDQRPSKHGCGLAVDVASAPVVQAAKHAEASQSGIGFQMIRILCDYLMGDTTQSSGSGSAAAWTRLMALDTSMSFAFHVPTAEHTRYAENIEARISASSSAHAPIRVQANHRPANLKWEEGLCEWVAATPFSHLKRTAMADAEGRVDQDGALRDISNISLEPHSERHIDAVSDTDSPCNAKVDLRISGLKRTASQMSFGCEDEDEDELSGVQPGQRALGAVAKPSRHMVKKAKVLPSGKGTRRSTRLSGV